MPNNTKRKYKLPCDCCGFEIIEGGEYCMIHPKIWEDKLGLGWNDNLCIGCVEKRLGRKLKGWRDIIYCPPNPGGFASSERYMRRRMGDEVFEASMLKPSDSPPEIS